MKITEVLVRDIRFPTSYDLDGSDALNRGDYSIIAFVGDENALSAFDRRDVSQAFSIGGDRFEIGLISVDHRWAMEQETAAVAR